MSKKNYNHSSTLELILILTLAALVISVGLITTSVGFSLARLTKAQSDWYLPTQKQGTFDFTTPIPTSPPPPPAVTNPPPPPPGPLPIGGAVPPDAPVYCIDDEDPDGCDDQTAFHVPKGVGGAAGSCGTVIEQGHKLVNSLPHFLKGMRDSLNPAITNCGYSTGSYSSGYVSTYFVIDAYNLAGFNDLSKNNPSHVSGANMLNWWKSQPAGYKFIPYGPTVIQQHASGQQPLTGCVMFLNIGSGVHVGIVNVLQQVNQNGDGVISILQSGARYYLDRFEVVGWDIKNTPLHQTQLNSVAGFGCRQ
ncbi:hypothetical protein HY612_05480 [Candidatus Roizmanbacteria bacterium]|nr:hypothetical protein [Candidatus Roizmanbacteria bacterium]